MKRGELYMVSKSVDNDPKKQRVFLIVSRQELIDKDFSTVICAPIYSNYGGLLTNYIGQLSTEKMQEVNTALRIALATG